MIKLEASREVKVVDGRNALGSSEALIAEKGKQENNHIEESVRY